MKLIGGPIDGKEIETSCRFVEAMDEDGSIARYESQEGRYMLIGHYARYQTAHGTEWVFRPAS